MEVDFVIPAKVNSKRIVAKNWRPFAGSDCLVDVTISKLLASGVTSNRIYVSCESRLCLRDVEQKWNVNSLLRPRNLTGNEVPLTTWIRHITSQVPGDADIAWCQVCDPLFDEYKHCLQLWPSVRDEHDSLVVCYPWKGYLMTENSQPMGWSFGEHHTASQQLPQWRTMPFTFSLLTRQAVADTGYHVGRTPFWYEATSRGIDIDTEQDFKIAQDLFRQTQGPS